MEFVSAFMSMVNSLFHLNWVEISIFQVAGVIIMPVRLAIVCFKYQLWIICLPYYSVKSVVRKILGIFRPTRMVEESPNNLQQNNRRKFCSPRTIARMLTNSPNPEYEQVLNATRDLRIAALNVIFNQISPPKLRHYRSNLENWSVETDKKIEEALTINADEKEMVNKLADVIVNFRNIKSNKAKLNDSICGSIANMVTRDCTTPAELKLIKKNLKNTNELEQTLQAERKNCLNTFNNLSNFNQVFAKTVMFSESLYDAAPIHPNDLHMDKVQMMCDKMKWEKTEIQQNQSFTEKKLEKILDMTETIKEMLTALAEQSPETQSNTELQKLKKKFEEQETELNYVITERNFMREKLDILEKIIDDQEDSLNASSRDYLSDIPIQQSSPVQNV